MAPNKIKEQKAVETSLHRALKERYGPDAGGRLEVTLGSYRIDAVAADGVLVEVQSGALGPLRGKLGRFLPGSNVRVVKPVIVARRVVRRARRDGADLSTRFSPKRGDLVDVFDDLIGLARVFPHPNLRIDVLAVEIDEVRVVRRRRPGYAVVDRLLREVVATVSLRHPSDLWNLLPAGIEDPFTTRELAERLNRPLAFAQKVAYCLRLSGAVATVGKAGNRRVYSHRAKGVNLGPVSECINRVGQRSATHHERPTQVGCSLTLPIDHGQPISRHEPDHSFENGNAGMVRHGSGSIRSLVAVNGSASLQ